jgi:hypothetical protein
MRFLFDFYAEEWVSRAARWARACVPILIFFCERRQTSRLKRLADWVTKSPVRHKLESYTSIQSIADKTCPIRCLINLNFLYML